jgi:hypothetical protein
MRGNSKEGYAPITWVAGLAQSPHRGRSIVNRKIGMSSAVQSGARQARSALRPAALDRKSPFLRNSKEKMLLSSTRGPTILADNLVSVLSRVAEGKGPLKPQQPVSRKGDAGAKSHPVRPGEIRSVPCTPLPLCIRKRLFCWPQPVSSRRHPPPAREEGSHERIRARTQVPVVREGV